MTEVHASTDRALQRPPSPTECRICGSAPAANVTFRGNVGMVVFFRMLTNPGPFCRNCGLYVFREMTSNTLMVGWWSWISAVVNPFTVLINVSRRRHVANLPAPQKDPNVVAPVPAPLNPGKPVLGRFQSWLGVSLFVIVLGAFVTYGVIEDQREQVGGCVDGTEFVSCDNQHDARIIAKVTTKDECPAETDSILQRGNNTYETWCLVSE